MTRLGFIAPRPALRATIHDQAGMVWRRLERGYRGRQPDSSEWATEVDRGFLLEGPELADALREANECRAELRAGATLGEALDRASSPPEGLGDEEPPVAPWFTEPPPPPAQRAGEGESDDLPDMAPKRERRPFAPQSTKRRGPPPKLTDEQVAQMRRDRPTTTVRALAERYGVSETTVHGICTGAMRADVTRIMSTKEAGLPPIVVPPSKAALMCGPNRKVLSFRQPPPVSLKKLVDIGKVAPLPPEPIPLRQAKREAVDGPTGQRARFEEWLRQVHPDGASRRQIIEARIFPVDTTDTHLNALRLQGRIVRLNGLWHRCGEQPPKGRNVMSKGRYNELRRQALAWFAKQPGPVTMAEMRASNIWSTAKAVDNARLHWRAKGWLRVGADGRVEITPAGRKQLGRLDEAAGAAHATKPAPTQKTNGVHAPAVAINPAMSIGDAVAQLEGDISAKQAALAALRALLPS